jgi:ribonuclease BN (tRNA processing enzyme)
VAAASEAGQLVLFHHDPAYPDALVTGMEASARARFNEVQAAYEGLEINLTPNPSPTRRGEWKRDVKYANHD